MFSFIKKSVEKFSDHYDYVQLLNIENESLSNTVEELNAEYNELAEHPEWYIHSLTPNYKEMRCDSLRYCYGKWLADMCRKNNKVVTKELKRLKKIRNILRFFNLI